MMQAATCSLKQAFICYLQLLFSPYPHFPLLLHTKIRSREENRTLRTPELFELMFQNYPDVVCVPQLCEMLGGISTKSAYKLLQENKIKHFRIGRAYKIPKANIISYLRSIMTGPPTLHCDALVH